MAKLNGEDFMRLLDEVKDRTEGVFSREIQMVGLLKEKGLEPGSDFIAATEATTVLMKSAVLLLEAGADAETVRGVMDATDFFLKIEEVAVLLLQS